MIMKIFIDTNILLDVFQNRVPHVDDSIQIWALAESRKADVFISAISFNNIFCIMRKHEGMNSAQRAVEVLNSNFSMVPLVQDIIGKAIMAKMPDFEDAIQFFSALSVEANCIVTRNVKDFPADILPILTPEAFLTQFQEQF